MRILVSQSCSNNVPVWCKTTDIYFLTILEAGSLKSTCWQGQALPKGSRKGPRLPAASFRWLPAILGATWLVDPSRSALPPSSHGLLSLHISLSSHVLLIKATVIGFSTHPHPVRPYLKSHLQRPCFWMSSPSQAPGVGESMNFQGTLFNPVQRDFQDLTPSHHAPATWKSLHAPSSALLSVPRSAYSRRGSRHHATRGHLGSFRFSAQTLQGFSSFLRVRATALNMPSFACTRLYVTWPPATSRCSSLVQSIPAPLRPVLLLERAGCAPAPRLCVFCWLRLAGSFPETPELCSLVSSRSLTEVEPCQWHHPSHFPELRLCPGTSGRCSVLYFSF